jgi:hypothetical protein
MFATETLCCLHPLWPWHSLLLPTQNLGGEQGGEFEDRRIYSSYIAALFTANVGTKGAVRKFPFSEIFKKL